MYQIAYIGRWEALPETAAAICDHDTPKLEALLQGGLDLDVPIQLSEYIKLMPLEIAVFRNDVPMIHFLLEHGADPGLAEEQPLLLTAARCCGPEVVALFAGQAAKLSSKQKERAFQEVRWGQRAENIPVLEQAGITVAKFGGEAFRAAVSEGNKKPAFYNISAGSIEKVLAHIDAILSAAMEDWNKTTNHAALRCPPMIFPFPKGQESNIAEFAVILKMDNDGDTVVYSPIPLPHLENQ